MISKLTKLFKNREFFTGSLLIFITIITIQMAWLIQAFKNNFDKYSLILAFGAGFFLLKSFIYTFNGLQEVFSLKKSFLLFLEICFYVLQIGLIFEGIHSLTVSVYPNVTLLTMALASTLFYVQTFALPNRQLGKFALFTTISYWLFAVLLFQTEWISYSPQISFLSLHFMALVVFLSEGWMLFRTSHIS